MSTDKERLDFWNANSLIEFGYSAKMGGDGAGWYWQLGTNRRSGIKNVRDTLDSAMAQLKKPKQVAQDVAQTPAMRHNLTPRTGAATYPADCLGKTFVVHRDCAAALETELTAMQVRAEKAEAELAAMKEASK
jgi:hypothetical protein